MFVDLSQYGKDALINTALVSMVDLAKTGEREITVMSINGRITLKFGDSNQMDEFVSHFSNVRGKYKNEK